MSKDPLDRLIAGESLDDVLDELIVGVQTPPAGRKKATKSKSNKTKEVPGRPGSGATSQTEVKLRPQDLEDSDKADFLRWILKRKVDHALETEIEKVWDHALVVWAQSENLLKPYKAIGDKRRAYEYDKKKLRSHLSKLKETVLDDMIEDKILEHLHESASSKELKHLDSGAKDFGGKRIRLSKTTISPGSHQQDYPTWLFPSQGDAEEFEDWALETPGKKFKTNKFKHKGKWAVEVV